MQGQDKVWLILGIFAARAGQIGPVLQSRFCYNASNAKANLMSLSVKPFVSWVVKRTDTRL